MSHQSVGFWDDREPKKRKQKEIKQDKSRFNKPETVRRKRIREDKYNGPSDDAEE